MSYVVDPQTKLPSNTAVFSSRSPLAQLCGMDEILLRYTVQLDVLWIPESPFKVQDASVDLCIGNEN